MAESIGDLTRKTVLAHRILALTGNMGTTTGHVFVRVPGTNEFLARGRRDGDYSPTWTGYAAFHRVNIDDGKAADEWEDWIMPPERHIAMPILKNRPDINVVIHAHPQFQVLCSITGVELRPILGSPYGHEAVKLALEGIPTYERSSLIASVELGDGVFKAIGNKTVCVLSAHGNVVCGRTVEEATLRAVSVEFLARHCWMVASAGLKAPDIRQDDIDEMLNPKQPAAIERRDAGVRAGGNFEWDYYVSLLEKGGDVPAEALLRNR